MRFLVTRPEPDAGDTVAALRRLGHDAIVEPLLTVACLPPPGALPEPAAIVCTSRNSVRALLGWPQAAGWLSVPVFAVGAATAGLAREGGFSDVQVAGGDAAALVELVRSRLEPGRGAILYPAARDRAGQVESGLAAAGLVVRVVEAYRAEAATALTEATVAAFRQQSIDGVLVFSRRTAETLRDLVRAAGLSDGLAGLEVYAISAEAAAPLHELPGVRVLVAARPDSEALLGLVPAP